MKTIVATYKWCVIEAGERLPITYYLVNPRGIAEWELMGRIAWHEQRERYCFRPQPATVWTDEWLTDVLAFMAKLKIKRAK